MKFKPLFLVVCVVFVYQLTWGAVRIADYNMCGEARLGLSTILEAIGNETKSGIQRPIDIMVLQEQDSVSTTTQAVVDVFNSLYGAGTYSRGTVDGATQGSGRPAIVYNTDTIVLLQETAINSTSTDGAARATMRYKLRPVGYTNSDAIFYIYVSHFKASTGSDNEDRRAVEAQYIRDNADALGDGVHIIYAGDFNLYSSSEPAWTILTGSGNGQAFDPVNRVGHWHYNSYYKDVHTQSPATVSYFPQQVLGGMDDRFDFQLITDEFKDQQGLSYISGTYHAFGNNGTHEFDDSISTGTGASIEVLAAIESTSDHIPVVADYQLPAKMTVTVESAPDYPLINDTVTLAVTVRNSADVDVAAGADELSYTISCTGDALGSASGSTPALSSGNTHYVTLDTSTVGPKTGQIIVTASSQAAEPGSFIQNISYTVIDSGATEVFDYSWDDFVYVGDPQAVLDADSELYYEVSENYNTGSKSIEISSDISGTYSVALAMVTDIQDGDQINASIAAKKLSTVDGVYLAAEYVTDISDYSTATGITGGYSSDCGTDWTTISNSWTVNTVGGAYQGLLITAVMTQPSQTVTLDDIFVEIPMHSDIIFPIPSTVECTSNPDMDFNSDCIVNLLDFAHYAYNWLDGVEGATSESDYPAVVITGIMDGALSSKPRAIELYVNGQVDLADYSLERSLGGAAWSDTTALTGTYENEFVYIIGSLNGGVDVFDTVFGTTGDFANHALETTILVCDGNDAFRLINNSTVVDQVYDQTSSSAYKDSYLYRTNYTGPDAGWVSTNWIAPGNDTLDGMSETEIAETVPFGTYVYALSDCTEQTYLDLNHDCQVNLPDLMQFAYSWLECNYTPDWVCDE